MLAQDDSDIRKPRSPVAAQGWWSNPMLGGDAFKALMCIIDEEALTRTYSGMKLGDYSIEWEGDNRPVCGAPLFSELAKLLIDHVAAVAMRFVGVFHHGRWSTLVTHVHGTLTHRVRNFQYIVLLYSHGDTRQPLVVFWEPDSNQLVVVADDRVMAHEFAADYLCRFGLVLTTILQHDITKSN